MPYSYFFGYGTSLYAQLTTVLGIAISTLFWRALYKRLDIWKEFISFASIPLILWIVFGTLDITITTRCAFAKSECEGNLASRLFFEHFGFFGGALVSFAWISLWSIIMLVIIKLTKKHETLSHFLNRTILYNLAFSHMLGFSTWLNATKPISAFFSTPYPTDLLSWIFPTTVQELLPGILLAIFHYIFEMLTSKGQKPTAKSS